MKWFKHMTDASDDEFISELEDIFGLEGYARWFKLLEIVAKQMDETGKCSASYSWKKWQSLLRGKRKKLETFLEHLENKQKTNRKQTGNILEIKIPKLLELRDNHTKNLQVTDKQEVEVEVELLAEGKPSARSSAHEPPIDENQKTDFQRVYDFGSAVFPSLAVANTSPIHQWIAEGCDVDLDIIPEIKRQADNRKPIRAWSYFTGGIADAKATRLQPMPEGKTNGKPTRNHRQDTLDAIYSACVGDQPNLHASSGEVAGRRKAITSQSRGAAAQGAALWGFA